MSILNKIRSSGTDDDVETTDSPDDLDPEDLLDHDEYTVTGEKYLFDEYENERVGGEEANTHIHDENPVGEEDTVAGPKARRMIEKGYLEPEDSLWFGYDNDSYGFREAGMKFSQLFRHLWVTGITGSGKTTALINMMLQYAYRGFGFTYFDPKGDDSRELLAKLPEHRMDDVIVVDPLNEKFEKTVSMNFLDMPDCDSVQERAKEVKTRLNNLKAFLQGSEYWGINMETITEVVGRGMLNANAMADEDDKKYTLVDMYFILLNAERRQNFAEEIDNPFLKDAMKEIGDMEDDAVRPTLKRLMQWVLDESILPIISHRESTLDFNEIIEEDKIVIVRTATDAVDIKKMLTLGPFRNLWSAIQKRADRIDGTPDPYFVICDEFDDIVSDKLEMDRILSKSRSKGFSATLAMQYPSQIVDKGYESVLKAMKNNCKNSHFMECEDDDDARIVMSRFSNADADDLLDTDQWRGWTELALDDGKRSNAVKFHTFAPYPFLRTMDDVDEFIRDGLDEDYGVDRLTIEEIQRNLVFGDNLGVIDGSGDLSLDEQMSIDVDQALAKAVFDEQLMRGENSIPVDEDLLERTDRYTARSVDTLSDLNHIIDGAVGEWVNKRTEDGVRYVTPTDQGRNKVFESGDSENAGKGGHRDLGEDTYRGFTPLGLEMAIVDQSGGRDVDGIGRAREFIDMDYSDVDAGSIPRVAAQRVEAAREDHPLLIELTGGANVTFEFEKSTGRTKKGQTIRNLSKAYNAGQKCIFTLREDIADGVKNALHEPVCVREKTDNRTRFYNLNKISIGGENPVIENAEKSVWWYDHGREEYVLEDESGTVRARFESLDAIFSNTSAYDGMESDYSDAELSDDGPHLTVNEPVIPQKEFERGIPDTDDFFIVTVPENMDERDEDPAELLQVVDDRGRYPIGQLLDTDPDQAHTAGKEKKEQSAAADFKL